MNLSTTKMPLCPLCGHREQIPFHQDKRRHYLRCRQCHLIHVPPWQRLDASQEKAVYDLHENNPDDAGYRRFLSRLFEPMRTRVSAPAQGLDFGCGPGPTLSLMFEEAGYEMALFDAFYANDPQVLQRRYDFITATEVVEHLFQPGWELARLLRLLKPGGWLGLMTKLALDREAFSRWHYKNDPTHVCFFSRETFHWLAAFHHCHVEFEGRDVILLQPQAH